MDKFFGASRADIVSTSHGGEISAESMEKRAIRAERAAKTVKKRGSGAWLRYGFCALLLVVCAVGKFTSLSIFSTVSDFIKDELNRDIRQSLVVANHFSQQNSAILGSVSGE